MTGDQTAPATLRRPPIAYTAGQAESITGGRIVWGQAGAVFAGCAYDSRVVGGGELFFAVCGDRTDGHLYLAAAAERGARVFLVGRWEAGLAASLEEWAGRRCGADTAASGPADMAVIQVDDPILAAGRLAAHHRRRFDLPVIGITGSIGKTTAKDMAAHILRTHCDILATEGNLNSHISLPVVLMQLDAQHRLAVLEMAARVPGDLDYLARLAAPSVGALTEIAPVHLETLGSLAGVAKAKAELLRALPASGLAIHTADSPALQAELAAGPPAAPTVSFGVSAAADVRAHDPVTLFRRQNGRLGASLSFSVTCRPGAAARRLGLPVGQRLEVTTAYPGRHNTGNILAAALCAVGVGVQLPQALARLADFTPKSAMRLDIAVHHGVILINDAYNANPQSMAAALEILAAAAGDGRKIAVLGDMLELGAYEREEHVALGRLAARCGLSLLVCLGPAMDATAAAAVASGMDPACVVRPSSHATAAAAVLAGLRAGDAVLVKGSRGMTMEAVVEMLRRGWRA